MNVHTSDPSVKRIQLKCEGTIKDPLKLEPAQVAFGMLKPGGGTEERIIEIRRGAGGPIKPEIVGVNSTGLTAALEEVKAGESYKMKLTLDTPQKNGSFRYAINMNTGVEEAPTRTIYAHGNVLPRLMSMPNNLTISPDVTEGGSASVALRWYHGNPGKIIGTECTIPGSSVNMIGNDSTPRIFVKIEPSEERLSGKHFLTIKTDDEDMPTLNVPFRFREPKAARSAGHTSKVRSRPAGRAVRTTVPKAAPLQRKKPD